MINKKHLVFFFSLVSLFVLAEFLEHPSSPTHVNTKVFLGKIHELERYQKTRPVPPETPILSALTPAEQSEETQVHIQDSPHHSIKKRGYTSLMCAIFNHESVEKIKMMILQGADPYSVAKDGNTALIVAIMVGRLEVVKHLIEVCKVDVNLANKNQDIPLSVAIFFQLHKIVHYLVEEGKLDIYNPINQLIEPLVFAQQLPPPYGDAKMIQYLAHAIARQAIIKEDEVRLKTLIEKHPAIIGLKDKEGCTLLLVAINEEKDEAVTVLIATQKALGEPDAQGNTPLMQAARKGKLKWVQLLLEKSNEWLTAKNDLNQDAVALAQKQGSKPIIQAIIFAMLQAYIINKKPLNQGLLKQYQQVVSSSQGDFDTLFLLAIQHKNFLAAHILLQHGADIDTKVNSQGSTRLMVGVFQLELEVIRFLLKNNANITLKDKKGYNVYFYLSRSKKSNRVQHKYKITKTKRLLQQHAKGYKRKKKSEKSYQ